MNIIMERLTVSKIKLLFVSKITVKYDTVAHADLRRAAVSA